MFHSLDKVTSLFIHVYPALCMTTITHHLPDALERYPALRDLKTNQLNVTETFVAAAISYFIWQGLYWRFVLIARRQKIEQGGRITSFTYMLNAKHGAIGRALSGVKPQYRESAFMAGQSVFTLVTMAPVPWIFSSSWFAGFYLLLLVSPSTCQSSLWLLIFLWADLDTRCRIFGCSLHEAPLGLWKACKLTNVRLQSRHGTAPRSTSTSTCKRKPRSCNKSWTNSETRRRPCAPAAAVLCTLKTHPPSPLRTVSLTARKTLAR